MSSWVARLHSHSRNPCLMWYKYEFVLVLWQNFFLQVLICWCRQWEKTVHPYSVSFFRMFLDSMVSSGHAQSVVLFLWTEKFYSFSTLWYSVFISRTFLLGDLCQKILLCFLFCFVLCFCLFIYFFVFFFFWVFNLKFLLKT